MSFGLTSWLVLPNDIINSVAFHFDPCLAGVQLDTLGSSSLSKVSLYVLFMLEYTDAGFHSHGGTHFNGWSVMEYPWISDSKWMIYAGSSSSRHLQAQLALPSSSASVAPRSHPPGSHRRAAGSTCLVLPGLDPRNEEKLGPQTESNGSLVLSRE